MQDSDDSGCQGAKTNGGRPGPARKSNLAVACMVLAIIPPALLMSFMCDLLWSHENLASIMWVVLLCFCLSPFAGIIVGHLGRYHVRKSAGTLSGSGLLTTALVVNYINAMMLVMGAVCCLPGFLEARDKAKKRLCQVNMRLIDTAVQNMLVAETNPVALAPFEGRTVADSIPTNFLRVPQPLRCPVSRESYVITNFCVICPGHMRDARKCEDHVL